MKRLRRLSRLGLVLGTAAVAAAWVVGTTVAVFADSTDNTSNQVSAAPDFVAPAINSAVVAKTPGYEASYVRQGGNYHVYANVAADTGNPASGIATVRANTSSFDTGQTSVAMTAGSYSVSGVSYNYRSASLGADNPLSEGSRAFTVTATDNAANSSVFNGSLTVDNTVPTASNVQTANGGATAFRPEQNDTITFTYSEPIDPQSILAGWNGTATDVVVRIDNDAISSNDRLQVYNSANAALLPLGTVNLGRNDYVGVNRTYGAGATTKSRMTRSGNSITIVLGTASGVGTTAAANGTMNWAPSTTAYDRAGNANTATAVNEGGAGDREF